MALQFVFGNSGAGKSHYLYNYIVKEAMENPKRNYLVIVPEQFTMQTQKDLVMAHPNKGIMNIDVLSFGRLAHRIFEEVGQNQRIILDDTGKSLILRKIAGDCGKELRVLGGNLKKHGYISEMKSVVERAGTFIGIRSGICDVIRTADCRKIALYPDYNYCDTQWKAIDIYAIDSFENIVVKDDFVWKRN